MARADEGPVQCSRIGDDGNEIFNVGFRCVGSLKRQGVRISLDAMCTGSPQDTGVCGALVFYRIL